MDSLLTVDGLSVSIHTAAARLPALSDVGFHVGRGEVVALVGESGSGKTLSALAVMGLLPEVAEVDGGTIRFEGETLHPAVANPFRAIRGARAAMIFQEPMTSLNPVLPVGEQIAETMVRHRGMSWGDARGEAVRLLEHVGIPEAGRRMRQYVHQLSGGMRQRVMIAGAMSCRPALLVADEPTTALDVTIQAQILELIGDLQRETGMGVLLITHDLGVVAEMADRAYVMYAGRIVEHGPARALIDRPMMPYTRGLLDSLPQADTSTGPLTAIPGTVPDIRRLPEGCAFAPRCRHAEDACTQAVPALESAAPDRAVRCRRWRELNLDERAVTDAIVRPVGAQEGPLVSVRGLSVHFPVGGGWIGRGGEVVRAVEDVSVDIARGEIVGLVGESGSGKTTIGRCLLGLVERTAGTIEFDGRDLASLNRSERKALKRRMQVVFQDPFASLNPMLTVARIIGEPIAHHGLASGSAVKDRVVQLLETVGLQARHAGLRPHAFSGGQRQRIAIARALAVEPDFIVADEAVSALDVSIRAQITNLLRDLRERLGLTMLFIAHDLSVVRHLCDRVVVLYCGRVMEAGPVDTVFGDPRHPYTRALLSAVPEPEAAGERSRIVLKGDAPSPIAPPPGCVFHTRCPQAQDRCRDEVPPMQTDRTGRSHACPYA